MAVGAAEECSEGRTHAVGADATRKVRAFKVPVSAHTDDPLNAAGLPEEGDEHPQRPDLQCVSVDAHLIHAGDWRFYLVTCEYLTTEFAEALRQSEFASAAARASSGSNPEDPTTQPMEGGGGGSVTATKVLHRDLDGTAVLNSAKYPFSEAVTTPIVMARFTRQKNLAVEPFLTVITYVGKTNSATFNQMDQDTVLCEGVSWTRRGKLNKDGTFSIWYPSTASFIFNPLGFTYLEVLDCGFNDIDGKVFRDENDTPYPQPTLLNAQGKKTSSAEYKKFRVYDRADFNNMGFS